MKRMIYSAILSGIIFIIIGCFIDIGNIDNWIFTPPALFSVIYPLAIIIFASEEEKKSIYGEYSLWKILKWILPSFLFGAGVITALFLLLLIFKLNIDSPSNAYHTMKFTDYIIIQTIIPFIHLLGNLLFARALLSKEKLPLFSLFRILPILIIIRAILYETFINTEIFWSIFKIISAGFILAIDNKRMQLGFKQIGLFRMIPELFSFLRKCSRENNCEIGNRFASFRDRKRLITFLLATIPLSMFASDYGYMHIMMPQIMMYHLLILFLYSVSYIHFRIHFLFSSNTNENLLKELSFAPVSISDLICSIYIFFAKKTLLIASRMLIICLLSAFLLPFHNVIKIVTILIGIIIFIFFVVFTLIGIPEIIFSNLKQKNIVTALLFSLRIPFLITALTTGALIFCGLHREPNSYQVVFLILLTWILPFYPFYYSIIQITGTFESYLRKR